MRSTSLLSAIKRKYPSSHITWVTDKPAHHFFQNQTKVDRILTSTPEDLLVLSILEFDVAFCIDKSLKAAGILAQTQYDILYGYKADPTGAIVPATAAAEEYWQLGLDNHKKFYVNQKPETQLICEALELTYQRDPYDLVLSAAEQERSKQRRERWLGNSKAIVGINTGCSPVIKYKKMSVLGHRQLLSELMTISNISIVLLGGGEEDEHRNREIGYGFPVHQSPTLEGVRDGLVSVVACDVVITGDSLGMHMAIALKKWTVAWFGPTCAQEIDLYDRGEKVITTAPCNPCWKRSCQKKPMCYDLVPLPQMMESTLRGLEEIVWKDNKKISLSKQPFLETHSFPYP
ncbi:MAG: glycosyltransferase family 9 protein [Bdellovibrionales bacterium]